MLAKNAATSAFRSRLALLPLAILLLLLGMMWGAPPVAAAPTSAAQARAAVAHWLQQEPAPLRAAMGQVAAVTTYFAQDATPLYYVVSLRPSGFVIVAAEDRIEPIIAFAPKGHYAATGKSTLALMLSRDMPHRQAWVKALSTAPSAARTVAGGVQQKWAALLNTSARGPATGIAAVSDPRVDPLTQTTWSQQVAGDAGIKDCYNYYTPQNTSGIKPGNIKNYPSGCVATAMAQVMYFWQWPQTGVGTASFNVTVNGVTWPMPLRGGNGTGGAYAWSNMPLSPSPTSATTTQCAAIGALCADAGASIFTQYTAESSGAYCMDATSALLSVFKYSNARLAGSDYEGTPDLCPYLPNIVNPDLDAGYPVIFGIYGPDGGHCIVGDGYGYDAGTLYTHLNMGWSGDDDAWYNLPTIVAADLGYSFNTVTGCIYNVFTTGAGEVISGRVLDASGNPLAGVTVTAARGLTTVATTTSNSRGIFAFAKVASATHYTLTATNTGYATTSIAVTTGTSVSTSNWPPITASGNVWAANITMPAMVYYTVTPASGANGGIIPDTVQTVASGGSATFTATPNSGYTVNGWYLDGSPTAAQTGGTSFTLSDITANHTLQVTFAAIPTQLAFTVQPGTTAAGSAIAPAVQVIILDTNGNTITTASTLITLNLAANPGNSILGGKLMVNAVNGVATFNNLTLNKVGAGYILHASAAGLSSATSQTFNITPGTASQLAFTVQPSTTDAGSAITPAVQVAIQDAHGNTVPSAAISITLALAANPGNSTLGGTSTMTAVNGIATFSTLTLNNVGAGYTLKASATGLTGAIAISTAFTITAGAATQLAFTVQPGTTSAGSAISPAVQVTIENAHGNTVTNASTSITLALSANPGHATLGGKFTVNAVNGVATFNTLTVNTVATGYTLQATTAGLPSTTSQAFNITPGAAAQLAFTVQPGTTAAGSTLAPAVQVTIQDASGNTVPTAVTSITLALSANPGHDTLGGKLILPAVNGVATFDDLMLTKAGTGYALRATGAGLKSAISHPFAITAAAATTLAYRTQPANTLAGSSIAPPVTVCIQDNYGNTVTTATNVITIALGANPGGGVLGGTLTATASKGVATFGTLKLTVAGAGYTLQATTTGGLAAITSQPFNITPAKPAALVMLTQPATTIAGTPITPVTLQIQDAYGNATTATTTVSLALSANPGHATLGGARILRAVNGVVTFDTLTLTKIGSGYTLLAAGAGLKSVISQPFAITPAAPATLVYQAQPTNTVAGNVITPAVTVLLEDQYGNVTTASSAVTLALGANPGNTTLGGTLTEQAVNGMATFSDLSLTKTGAGYTLKATADGITAGITSKAFTITVGAAAKLAFLVQPTNTDVNTAIHPAVTVAIQDAYGNTVTTPTMIVTLAIGANPGAATLAGLFKMNTVNGVATFSNLLLNKIGNAYTLTAAAPRLTGTTSLAFDIISK